MRATKIKAKMDVWALLMRLNVIVCGSKLLWLVYSVEAFIPVFHQYYYPKILMNHVSRKHVYFQRWDALNLQSFTSISSTYHVSIPEANPTIREQANKGISLSGTSYEDVLTCLEVLYPPNELHQRNALSRTDGYWSYIKNGHEPPQDLTYGEYDFYFFAQLLDHAAKHYYNHYHNLEDKKRDWSNKVFSDIGSGTGRLVLAASGLHPHMKICRGIELLQGINDAAIDTLGKCKGGIGKNEYVLSSPGDYDRSNVPLQLPMAPVHFVCGSIEDPDIYIGDSDLIFVFSTCMGESLMQIIANAIGRQCKPGTIVITTDYMLPLHGCIPRRVLGDQISPEFYQLELVEKMNGWCWLTGGSSTAYIHRVVQSSGMEKH